MVLFGFGCTNRHTTPVGESYPDNPTRDVVDPLKHKGHAPDTYVVRCQTPTKMWCDGRNKSCNDKCLILLSSNSCVASFVKDLAVKPNPGTCRTRAKTSRVCSRNVSSNDVFWSSMVVCVGRAVGASPRIQGQSNDSGVVDHVNLMGSMRKDKNYIRLQVGCFHRRGRLQKRTTYRTEDTKNGIH